MKDSVIKVIIASFLLSITLSCHQTNRTEQTKVDSLIYKPKANWEYLKCNNSTILFKDSQSFNTNLFDLEYIGKVYTSKTPFLIFSGRYCDECDANISLYIHRADLELITENRSNAYQYPGTLKDYETGQLYSHSRAFYGEVLKDTHGVIWYDHMLLENGDYGDFVFLSIILNNNKSDTSFQDNGLLLKETLELQSAGKCIEIEGKDFTSEP